jgi:hypothetical protein
MNRKVLKPKCVRRFKFRSGDRRVVKPATSEAERPAVTEKKITLLGVVTRDEPDEVIAFSFSPAADPAAITAALEQAERERIERRAAESKRIAELFPLKDKIDG